LSHCQQSVAVVIEDILQASLQPLLGHQYSASPLGCAILYPRFLSRQLPAHLDGKELQKVQTPMVDSQGTVPPDIPHHLR
jgi:hypothetical protein